MYYCKYSKYVRIYLINLETNIFFGKFIEFTKLPIHIATKSKKHVKNQKIYSMWYLISLIKYNFWYKICLSNLEKNLKLADMD